MNAPATKSFVRLSIANVVAKQIVRCHDSRGNEWISYFRGFSDLSQKYGESGPVFDTLHEAKAKLGVKNMKEIEALGDDREYGYSLYAHFSDVDGSEWSAYVFNGRWCVGSSADTLRIERIES